MEGVREWSLTHQTGESLECPWDPDARVDLYQYALGGVNVDLQESSFVEWGVKECEKALPSSAPSHQQPRAMQ